MTYDNFYNISKTWAHILLDINMLRRKLQANCFHILGS